MILPRRLSISTLAAVTFPRRLSISTLAAVILPRRLSISTLAAVTFPRTPLIAVLAAVTLALTPIRYASIATLAAVVCTVLSPNRTLVRSTRLVIKLPDSTLPVTDKLTSVPTLVMFVCAGVCKVPYSADAITLAAETLAVKMLPTTRSLFATQRSDA